MADDDEPLLARDGPSDALDDRALAEEDALLTGATSLEEKKGISRRHKYRELGLFAWAIAATVVALVVAVLYQKSSPRKPATSPWPSGKRNLIFMVSDGMGPSSLSLTRSFMQLDHDLPDDNDPLVLDNYLIGQSRTRSSSSLITDSAAGATAFSCGEKSYNGAISVSSDGAPCGTVLEAAKAAGYMTGLVVTTRITDATPACFASHVHMRSEEDSIAEQLLGDNPLGRNVDLLLGGGRCHFLPNTTQESCRADSQDLIAKAKKGGFNYISTRKEFDGLSSSNPIKLPMVGLFADYDIPYEIDRQQRNDLHPSLAEMAETALRALSTATQKNDKGFFLMIEGSRIDHAGHANDPVAQPREVLAYDTAFETVLDFLDSEKTPGILVATSDHETGGLAVGLQLEKYEYPEYVWHPSVLTNATHSIEWVTHDYARYLRARAEALAGGTSPPEVLALDPETYLRDALATFLGINDPTSSELDLLITQPRVSAYTLGEMVSRRALIGWSTHGHTAADVNIYASDHDVARELKGVVENTEVGQFLQHYLEVDVDAITKKLRENSGDYAWMGETSNSRDLTYDVLLQQHYDEIFDIHA